MQRRTLLSVLCTGTISLAGCISESGTIGFTDGGGELPEDCPTSQGLDIEWPDEVTTATVEPFIESYEAAYYREIVVEYAPESKLASYELNGNVTDGPTEVENGWELTYSGGGGIYRPTLLLEATTSDPPEWADLVPVSEIDADPLLEMLETAAETGKSEFHVDSSGERIDRYVDRFTSLSDDFEQLSGPGDSDTLYVDVDGTEVELTVTATTIHGDYGWEARYYVDAQVVRRTTDPGTAAQDGELLECRSAD